MSNGKGSGRRPAAVDDAKVASEWDRIFPAKIMGPTHIKPDHVCGLTGYNPMIDPECPGCVERHRPIAERTRPE